MRIAIASDHRGFEIKKKIADVLTNSSYKFDDFGTNSVESVDYPSYAKLVAVNVSLGKYDYGILICATGIGMCIAANKIKGIRAAVCRDVFEARRARAHNNANILCLGADLIKMDELFNIIMEFLTTPFEAGRHQRRLDEITEIENL